MTPQDTQAVKGMKMQELILLVVEMLETTENKREKSASRRFTIRGDHPLSSIVFSVSKDGEYATIDNMIVHPLELLRGRDILISIREGIERYTANGIVFGAAYIEGLPGDAAYFSWLKHMEDTEVIDGVFRLKP